MFSGESGDLAAKFEGVLSFHDGVLLAALMDFMKMTRAPPAARVCCDILKSCIRYGMLGRAAILIKTHAILLDQTFNYLVLRDPQISRTYV